jgi:hypothetical protein
MLNGFRTGRIFGIAIPVDGRLAIIAIPRADWPRVAAAEAMPPAQQLLVVGPQTGPSRRCPPRQPIASSRTRPAQGAGPVRRGRTEQQALSPTGS